MISVVDAFLVLVTVKLQGKFKAMVVCWFLGLGSLISWNSMLTIGDYYYQIFPVSIIYEPIALNT